MNGAPLIVGVDVHHKTNTYCLMTEDGQEVVPRFTLAHNRCGTQTFLMKVRPLLESGRFSRMRVAAEATGWYWFPLWESLRRESWSVDFFLLNPRSTANFKKSYVDIDKSDRWDALVIADHLRWGRNIQASCPI